MTGLIITVLFVRNVISPDYPFHLHEIWAVYDGHMLTSPFMGGGSHPIYRYGLPIDLLGALLFPILEEYTVGALIGVSLPLLWLSSKKVFENFVDGKTAKIAAFLAVLNPATYGYVLASVLPFLWATAFGMFSLYFFLEGKKWRAAIIGILAIFTHPLSALLFASILLIKPDFRKWLKTYFAPMFLFLIQIGIFFHLFANFYTGEVGLNTRFLFGIPLLMGVLAVCYILRKDTRLLSGTGLLGTVVWSFLGLIGFWVPLSYFDRPAFFIFLLLIPFVLKITLDNLQDNEKFLVLPVALSLVFVGAFIQVELGLAHETVDLDNEERRDRVADIVENEYVYFASQGSDLYELPRFENVKFSNTGKFPHQKPPENVGEYIKMLEKQNASYILVHGKTPDNELIENAGFPLLLRKDELRLYKVEILDNNYE